MSCDQPHGDFYSISIAFGQQNEQVRHDSEKIPSRSRPGETRLISKTSDVTTIQEQKNEKLQSQDSNPPKNEQRETSPPKTSVKTAAKSPKASTNKAEDTSPFETRLENISASLCVADFVLSILQFGVAGSLIPATKKYWPLGVVIGLALSCYPFMTCITGGSRLEKPPKDHTGHQGWFTGTRVTGMPTIKDGELIVGRTEDHSTDGDGNSTFNHIDFYLQDGTVWRESPSGAFLKRFYPVDERRRTKQSLMPLILLSHLCFLGLIIAWLALPFTEKRWTHNIRQYCYEDKTTVSRKRSSSFCQRFWVSYVMLCMQMPIKIFTIVCVIRKRVQLTKKYGLPEWRRKATWLETDTAA